MGAAGCDADLIARLARTVEDHKGGTPVYFSLTTSGGNGGSAGGQPVVVTMKVDPRFYVRPCQSLQQRIAELLGPGRLKLIGPRRRPRRTPTPAPDPAASGPAVAAESPAAAPAADRFKDLDPGHIDDAIDAEE